MPFRYLASALALTWDILALLIGFRIKTEALPGKVGPPDRSRSWRQTQAGMSQPATLTDQPGLVFGPRPSAAVWRRSGAA